MDQSNAKTVLESGSEVDTIPVLQNEENPNSSNAGDNPPNTVEAPLEAELVAPDGETNVPKEYKLSPDEIPASQHDPVASGEEEANPALTSTTDPKVEEPAALLSNLGEPRSSVAVLSQPDEPAALSASLAVSFAPTIPYPDDITPFQLSVDNSVAAVRAVPSTALPSNPNTTLLFPPRECHHLQSYSLYSSTDGIAFNDFIAAANVNLFGETIVSRFADIRTRNRFIRKAFTVSFISYGLQAILGGILVFLVEDFGLLTGTRKKHFITIATKKFLRERWGLLIAIGLLLVRVILQLGSICIQGTRGRPNCINITLTIFGILFGGCGAAVLTIHTVTISPLLAVVVISAISLFTVFITICCSCCCPLDIKDCGDCYTCFVTLVTASLFVGVFLALEFTPYPATDFDEYIRIKYTDKNGRWIDKSKHGTYLWPYVDLVMLLFLTMWPVQVLWTLQRVLTEIGQETTEDDWMLLGARF